MVWWYPGSELIRTVALLPGNTPSVQKGEDRFRIHTYIPGRYTLSLLLTLTCPDGLVPGVTFVAYSTIHVATSDASASACGAKAVILFGTQLSPSAINKMTCAV